MTPLAPHESPAAYKAVIMYAEGHPEQISRWTILSHRRWIEQRLIEIGRLEEWMIDHMTMMEDLANESL